MFQSLLAIGQVYCVYHTFQYRWSTVHTSSGRVYILLDEKFMLKKNFPSDIIVLQYRGHVVPSDLDVEKFWTTW